MDIKLQPNITGTNVNLVKGATQADITNAVNNAKTYRDEAQAFSIVSEDKSIESAYSALNASVSATTAIDKAIIATNKATEANNSANSASASEAVCIAKATIATDKADIATAQSVIATYKANEASISANTANIQAGMATTKASEASTSASNALTSENNADTSEANALIYRNQAESFANSINPSDLVHISGTETITGNKTFSGTVSGLTKATVGLSSVDNTSDANKPISNAVQTALYLKADKANTLGGYGITDAYTKTSTDSLIDIHSKTAKTTLENADEFMTADSTSTFSLKKITWSSIKTLLVNLFISKVTSTDNAIVRFNGTTGDVQNSNVFITDDNKIGVDTSTPLHKISSYKATGWNIGVGTQSGNRFIQLSADSYFGTDIFWDNTSSLRFSTGSASDATGYTERMRIDSNGNVGIGVTPTTGYSNMKALELGDSTTFYGYNGASAKGYGLCANGYRNAAGNYLYRNSNYASLYESYQGAHYWFNAQSGTAGNAITWTTAMALDASGNLLLQSGTGGLGYGTGAGGTVTQLTSKSTSVTLNKPSGVIFTSNTALAAGASAIFTFNNNSIRQYDNLITSGNDASYRVEASATGNGYCSIRITNLTGSSLSQVVEISFQLIRGATA